MSAREMTIDQLASAVGMTVRNVRAYATRGLLPSPKLVGRKGFYGPEHEARLRLIRDLIDRGYTLGAVEKALVETPELPDPHALDLLGLLANPWGGGAPEPEEISRDTLATLAGIEGQPELRDALVAAMEERRLVEVIDDDTLRLLQPVMVRTGAKALHIGMSMETVLGLFEVITQDTSELAQRFVDAARAEVWKPFAERGMPDAEWEVMLRSFEAIIPVAVQSVLAGFRQALTASIENAMAEEINAITPEQLAKLLPPQS
ncbi:MerR family transcriptional regulator [Nocardioides sp. Bht2]|uniref:MerR family transcriptional regulator n=1 Tax=Nocardioides sp. Bht2 TaxID=3392297 RepID=UPI0039B3BBD7